MVSPTSESSRTWLLRNAGRLDRFIRQKFKYEDIGTMYDMVFNQYPDEGRKLVQNYNLSEHDKYQMFIDFLIFSPITIAMIMGDQRSGKDAFLGRLFSDVIDYSRSIGKEPPRIVTVGNMRCMPFMDPRDMYFSFENLPSGTKEKEVWVYCSEMELVIPAREGTAQENKLYAQLSGTFAQNHIKVFGCVKLAAKCDLNFVRDANIKISKFICPDKLSIEGVERKNIISGLAQMMLPKNRQDRSETLLCFDNQLFTIHLPLASFWNDNYSEQFRDIPMDKISEYTCAMYTNGLKEHEIIIAVKQKFRKSLSVDDVVKMLGPLYKGRR